MTVLIQRPLKGSRISSFYPVKTLPPITALDSAFQLQEYISLLIRLDVHDVEKIVAIPGKDQNDSPDNGAAKGDEKDADKDVAGGVNVDPACWVYEHLRRVAQDLSHPLITMLQQECTRNTCPEMKAGEWLYLCVAHGNEGAMEQCCAIDYILHTLDSATALLNSPRAFPSRLSVPSTSHRHFTSLCRRLGRIFAHAYFHHRDVFEQAEAESSLYARFLALVKYFDLVPLEFLVIPPRLEGRAEPVEPPRLMGAALEPRRDTLRPKSPPGPAGDARGESPRKFGRARTDTMVYSEAFSVAEELAKGDPEVDIDREIAAERAALIPGAGEPFVPPTAAGSAEAVYVPPVAPIEPPVVAIAVPPSQEEPQPAEEAAAAEPAPAEHSTESVAEGDPPAAPPAEEAPSEELEKASEEAHAPATENTPSEGTEDAPAAAAEPVAEPAPEEAPKAKEAEEAEESAPSEAEAPAPEEATELASTVEQPSEAHAETASDAAPESTPSTEDSAVEEPVVELPTESPEKPAEEAEAKEPSEAAGSDETAETASYAAVAATASAEAAPAEEEAKAKEAEVVVESEEKPEGDSAPDAVVKEEPEAPPADS